MPIKPSMNIIIAGVGGQGTLLASRILGRAFISEGFDVKVSEVHGMSQRGGSVVTYVKYGEAVHSPIVDEGGADMIIAFELLEAARYLPYLKKGGKMIVNTQKINPMPVITGQAEYPSNILKNLSDRCDVTAFDALTPAIEAGSVKAVNIVLLGKAARFMGFGGDLWSRVIAETVPPKFLEMNLKAFDLGFQT
ncbi:MAG: indolepyruvate oxidoreductase subunit beta [Oscillospiraceae bacterium]|nr:indolepyruvate oxidoreductase subunit beta [Oscillospiraceae bacterium]